MRKTILALAIILLSITTFAQEATPYKTSLIKMMELSGAQQTYKAVAGQMITMFKQQKPEIPAEFWSGLEEMIVKSAANNLVDMLLPVYQKHLTEDDLKNMIIFYQTPTGKKFAEKTPVLAQESMAAGQEWGKKIGEEFVKKLQEKGY